MKRVVAGVITVGMFALLFYKIGAANVAENLRRTQWAWFSLAILAFIPQILVIAHRWRRMVNVFCPLTLADSTRMVLASATMNLVLPSKMGDLSKGWFLRQKGSLDLPRAMNIVVFEKMLDVACLALFMLLGTGAMLAAPMARGMSSDQMPAILTAMALGIVAVLAVLAVYFIPLERVPGYRALIGTIESRPRLRWIQSILDAGSEVVSQLQSRGARRGEILSLTAAIWVLHLVQIYCFFRSVGAVAPIGQFTTMVPLAIFIGLIPVSIAGFGTRDYALVQLFPAIPEATMLAAALYVNLRYLLPALAGLPFLSRSLALISPNRDPNRL